METQFEDIYGYKHILKTEISRGGQGAVYRTANPNIAMKLDLDIVENRQGTKKPNEELLRSIRNLRLLPIPRGLHLTLPIAHLKNGHGYIMTLLSDMESFDSAFYKDDQPNLPMNSWLRDMERDNPEAAITLAAYMYTGGLRKRLLAFLKAGCILAGLHMNGLVFCDFSPKNVFISSDRLRSNVWLIDADNVNYLDVTRYSGIYTPKYGAPEVVRGMGCSMWSDVYSFAVALFYILTEAHPFIGPLTDGTYCDFLDEADGMIDRGEAPWICDLEDDRNNADSFLPADLVLNDELMSLFHCTFSQQGREKPTSRPSVYEWCPAIASHLDTLVECTYCGMHYSPMKFECCPWCDHENSFLSVLVYNSEGEIIRRFYTEMRNEGRTEVPLRLIAGFSASQVEESLFHLSFSEEKVFASDFHPDYEINIRSGSGLERLVGRVVLDRSVKLLCTEVQGDESCVLEVSMN